MSVPKLLTMEEAQREAAKVFSEVDSGASKRKMKSVRASMVMKKKPQWLWRGFIPDRKLSILASDPGIGKSLVTCAVAANITRGGMWPDGTHCPQGSVIMLNAEDLNDEDITPRLEACGADLDKVTLTDSTVSEEASETEKVFSLKHDIESLFALVDEIGDVRLIIIDPLNAFLGSEVNANKDSEIREILKPLQILAENKGLAVVVLSHLNKAVHLEAIHRVSGSMGITGAARGAWTMIKDQADENRRLILPLKMNHGPDDKGFAFRIIMRDVEFEGDTPEEYAVAEFEAERHHLTAQQALERKRDSYAKDQAEELIEHLLKDEPMRSSELENLVVSSGTSLASYRRARKSLGIKSRPVTNDSKQTWWSLLPDQELQADQQ